MTGGNWKEGIAPRDWAAMTRLHESTHVTASEALGIPVSHVWANPDRSVAHGGQYRNGPGDSQLQSVVYLIGAEGGAQELRERGYDEDLVGVSVEILGANDRTYMQDAVAEAAEQGYLLNPQRAHSDALAILHSPGFRDAAHNVAEALADRGDRLDGADTRAALGDFQLDDELWVPAWRQLDQDPPQPHTRAATEVVGRYDDLDLDLDL